MSQLLTPLERLPRYEANQRRILSTPSLDSRYLTKDEIRVWLKPVTAERARALYKLQMLRVLLDARYGGRGRGGFSVWAQVARAKVRDQRFGPGVTRRLS